MPTLLPRFTIEQPTSLAEASDMLLTFGDEGRAYAGGTELLLAMKQAGLRYQHLVDLKTIAGLEAIEERDGQLWIGALATHLALERSALVRARRGRLRQSDPTPQRQSRGAAGRFARGCEAAPGRFRRGPGRRGRADRRSRRQREIQAPPAAPRSPSGVRGLDR